MRTAGIAPDLDGTPSAIRRPLSSTMIRSQIRMTIGMSCSTSRIVSPASRSPTQPRRQFRCFGVVKARRRLIEHQQLGFHRQARARSRAFFFWPYDRLPAGWSANAMRSKRSSARKRRLGDRLVAPPAEGRDESAEQRDADAADGAGRDVVEHRDVGKDAQILVSAGDAETGDSARIESGDGTAVEADLAGGRATGLRRCN